MEELCSNSGYVKTILNRHFQFLVYCMANTWPKWYWWLLSVFFQLEFYIMWSFFNLNETDVNHPNEDGLVNAFAHCEMVDILSKLLMLSRSTTYNHPSASVTALPYVQRTFHVFQSFVTELFNRGDFKPYRVSNKLMNS